MIGQLSYNWNLIGRFLYHLFVIRGFTLHIFKAGYQERSAVAQHIVMNPERKIGFDDIELYVIRNIIILGCIVKP